MKNDNQETPYTRLHKLVYQQIKRAVVSNERIDATAVGQDLWRAINRDKKFKTKMTLILATEGAHQFAMKAIQKFGPLSASTQQIQSKLKERTEPLGLFDFAGIKLPKEEYNLVSELADLGLQRVRTKTWGYVLIATATAEQLSQAIALRAAQISTMNVENDLMTALAKIRAASN
jgi:hypothetical protein